MKVYWDNSGTWTQVTGLIRDPEITTRLDLYGVCTVVLRDAEGSLYATWSARDFADMLITDDSDNYLFQGILINRKFREKELELIIAGFGIKLEWNPFNKNYIYEEGRIKTVNASDKLDLYDDLDEDGSYDVGEDFGWTAGDYTNNDVNLGIIISDTTDDLNSKTWDASAVVETGCTIEEGNAASTDAEGDGNALWISESGATWNSYLTATIDGDVIDSTTEYIKRIEISYSIYGYVDEGSLCKVKLQIDKDGTYQDVKVCTLNVGIFDSQLYMDGKVTLEETSTEMAKYFTKVGDNYTELKGLRVYFENVEGNNIAIDCYIDFLEVEVYYDPLDIGQISHPITANDVSYINSAGVTWTTTGVEEDDIFMIGENTTKILHDVGIEAGVALNVIKDTSNTSTLYLDPDGDIDIGAWSDAAGGDNNGDLYDELDDAVRDPAAGDGNYIEATSTTTAILSLSDNLGVGDFQYATTIEVYAYGITILADTCSVAYQIGSGDVSSFTDLQFAGGWAWKHKTIGSGLTLTRQNIKDLKIHLKCTHGAGAIDVDALYVKITYVQDDWNKYIARHFKGLNCLHVLESVRKLEGAHWCEDHVNKTIKVLRVADFEASGVSLTNVHYDPKTLVFEDECNQVKRVEVYGSTQYGIRAFAVGTATGQITKVIVDDTITSKADAQAMADALQTEWNSKRPSIKCEVDGVQADIQLGYTANIALTNPTVGATDYPIRMISRNQRGLDGIKTTLYAGMGESPDDEKLAKIVRKIGYLTHKAMADKLVTSPITGDTKITWGDVGGAVAAVEGIITAELVDGQSIDEAIDDLIDAIPVHTTCPEIYGGNDFTQVGEWWQVAHSDNNAYVQGVIICPKTSTTWRLVIVSRSDTGSITDSGKLRVGATAAGEVATYTNIYNDINFDLVHPVVVETWVFTETANFSAVEGDVIKWYWAKDNNAGAGNLRFDSVYIYEA